jgi:hypothetical protein
MTSVPTKSPVTELQALVFGASGITGWAITNSALLYPTSTTLTRVVGLTSRPLSLKDSGFPSDPRLQLYSGLDLSQDAETSTQYLKKIDEIDEITHVYFAGKMVTVLIQVSGNWLGGGGDLAYVHQEWDDEDSEQRIKDNVDFIVNVVAAVE